MPNGTFSKQIGSTGFTVEYDIVEASARHLNKHLNARPKRQKVIRIMRIYGPVKATVTKGREAAPNPASKKNLTHTSMDKGHLIALQLGGIDSPLNIVPQCRFWQQSGEWRQDVEIKILKMIEADPNTSYTMTVDCHYKRSPTDPWQIEVTLKPTFGGVAVFHKIVKNDFSQTDLNHMGDTPLDDIEFSDSGSDSDDESDNMTDRDIAAGNRIYESFKKASLILKVRSSSSMSMSDDSDSDSDYELTEAPGQSDIQGYKNSW